MSITDAVNDNLPTLDLDDEVVAKPGEPDLENVVAAAILVSTAFRLRDEDALILTLRRLADAVDALEAADAQTDDRQAACG